MADGKVFVKIDEYKDILDIISMIRNKLDGTKKTLGKINELKNREDSELESWSRALNEIEKKVDFIDKALFEPETLK